LKYSTRDIFFVVFVAAIYFAMRTLAIESHDHSLEAFFLTPALIATLIGCVVCWPSTTFRKIAYTCSAVSLVVASTFQVDYISFWPHEAKGKVDASLIFLAYVLFGSCFGTIVTYTLLSRSEWIAANIKPAAMTLAIAAGTALLGFILGSLEVFQFAKPHQAAMGFFIVGLILGTAWAHWLIGFKNEPTQ